MREAKDKGKTRGTTTYVYDCDGVECDEQTDWYRIPPLWILLLNEGMAHSEPGFEFHFCSEKCMVSLVLAGMLNQVPG